jgi:hypothetical protein
VRQARREFVDISIEAIPESKVRQSYREVGDELVERTSEPQVCNAGRKVMDVFVEVVSERQLCYALSNGASVVSRPNDGFVVPRLIATAVGTPHHKCVGGDMQRGSTGWYQLSRVLIQSGDPNRVGGIEL